MWLLLGGAYPKNLSKRPSKGKFKPKQKFRNDQATLNAKTDHCQTSHFCAVEQYAYEKSATTENFENPRWRRPSSWIRKMLIVSARMKRFSPNLNSIRLAITFNDLLGQNAIVFQNPRWRWRPSWILKVLIASARMKRFSPNFNSIHLAVTFNDPRGCKFPKIKDGGGGHLGFQDPPQG